MQIYITLLKAINACRASEVSKSQMKSLSENDKSAHVQVAKKKKTLIHKEDRA